MTWAVATALASFLPVIGTLVVWVQLSGYLLMEAIPFEPCCSHPLLTLIALLGGIEVFGLAGLIIAPIVMSVFVAAFRLYEREVRTGAIPAANAPPTVDQ